MIKANVLSYYPKSDDAVVALVFSQAVAIIEVGMSEGHVSESSKIEWTDTTWNPLRGCTKISPGCKHCYAETFAERFRGVAGHPYEQGFDLRLVPEKLSEPFLWSSPRCVFVNSMSDLFQPDVPDAYIVDVVKVMLEANWHTYQVLTKRSERLMNMLNGPLCFLHAQYKHIWWGVSVEDKSYGLPRVSHLQETTAAVKFLSVDLYFEVFLVILISPDRLGDCRVWREWRGARPMKKECMERITPILRTGTKSAFFFEQWGGSPQEDSSP